MKSLGFALFCLLCTVAWAQENSETEPENDETPQQIAFSTFTATYTGTEGEYAISTANLVNWYTAELLCRAEGYKLVTIESQAQQEDIIALVNSLDDVEELNAIPLWTSGSNHGVNSKYMWNSSGKQIRNYEEFLVTPSKSTTRCVGFNPSTYNWSNHDCRELRYFMCQKATEAGACT